MPMVMPVLAVVERLLPARVQVVAAPADLLHHNPLGQRVEIKPNTDCLLCSVLFFDKNSFSG